MVVGFAILMKIYSLIYSFFPIKNIPNLDKVDFGCVNYGRSRKAALK